MYGCESWTIKKTEHWRIDTFELKCWRRLLRVPWAARRSNKSFLKEINPEYSLEGLMMKLKLQYFGHLMQRANSLEKTLAEKDWGQKENKAEEEMVRWHHQVNEKKFEQTPGIAKDRESWCTAVHGITKSQIELKNSNNNNVRVNVSCQICSCFAQIGLEHYATQIISKSG